MILNDRASKPKKQGVLVLGIGNVLLSDEGVGVQAVMELRRRYAFPAEVKLLDGGTSGMELLPALCDCASLIIIDAVKTGYPAGSVVRIEGADVPKTFMTRISPHQLGISDILATASLTDDLPHKMVLFGVEPESLEVGLILTETVRAGFDQLLDAVIAELESIGFSPQPPKELTAYNGSNITDYFFSTGGGER